MTYHGRTIPPPRVGIVLGSGLGAFAEEVEQPVTLAYREMPGWPVSTAAGHAGKLVFGYVSGVAVAVMAGRVHLYEGYSAAQVVHGVRELGRLGVEALILTNAAGAIRPDFATGTLVAIADHINLQGVNPLTGPNDDQLGPRFPDMSEAYARRYREVARKEACALGIRLEEGVYAAVSGPSYETPAEIRYLRAIGADLVGMSTALEVIAANHMGIRCLGISTVTNPAAGVTGTKLVHDDVLAAGRAVRGQLGALLKAVIPRLVT